MVALAVESDALRDYIGELQCVAELHVFHDGQTTSAERVSTMLQLAAQLDTAMIAVAFDSVRFSGGSAAHWSISTNANSWAQHAQFCRGGGKGRFRRPQHMRPTAVAGSVTVRSVASRRRCTPPDTALTSPADVLRNFLTRASAMAVSQTDGSEVAGIVAALGENESDFAQHALVRPSAAPERLSPALALSGINGFVGRSVIHQSRSASRSASEYRKDWRARTLRQSGSVRWTVAGKRLRPSMKPIAPRRLSRWDRRSGRFRRAANIISIATVNARASPISSRTPRRRRSRPPGRGRI